ncbi:Membrane-flanked domain [Nostocoides japonicum T1-X7]|uniref:Membrane-flanked domain n=1 Tax=Nostocoides japonicum T1-X7 TaxID=1194083 RepID=A0A077LVN2_9MICO|nr:PH domain-containing protein [Tetrasphaera japonica]CCH76025.1 Membrane-flanked domain [Tetrasphaera japonica T1-X7]
MSTESVLRLREPTQRVSPRARLLWVGLAILQGAVLLAVLLLLTLVWHVFDLAWWMVALVLLVGIAYAVVMPTWRWRVHRWEVTDTAVYTQHGWFVVERRIAPLSRVQTVDVHRGPLSQLLRLSAVTVTTASAAGPLRIEGLDAELAARVVDDITTRTEAERGDAT